MAPYGRVQAASCRTALVVDDYAPLRQAVARGLGRQGVTVHQAATAAEAIAVCEIEPVDTLVSDVVMPDMLGGALAAIVARACPGIHVLLMSGSTDHVPTPKGIAAEQIGFIAKPFSNAELLTAVENLRPTELAPELPPPELPAETGTSASEPRSGAGRTAARRGPLRRAAGHLPQGHTLPDQAWQQRHRWLLILLWAHIPLLLGLAFAYGGQSVSHIVLECSSTAVLALLAGSTRFSRRARACMVALGLLTCSALLVHVAHGMTEMHFHFFVVVALLTLYEDWIVVFVAAAFVLLHHGALGSIDQRGVYGHGGNALKLAALHSLFVTAVGAVGIVSWRLEEQLRAEQQQTLHAMQKQALRDPLTGLPNRRLFIQRLTTALADEETFPSVFYMDIDGFRAINDAYGQHAGDRLLVEITERLRTRTAAGDTLARFGSDEFVLLRTTVRDEEDAFATAAQLSQTMLEPFRVADRLLEVSYSIGYAGWDSAERNPEELIRRAGLALARAKAQGPARFESGTGAMLEAEQRRVALRDRLEAAINNDEMVLHYQPIIDLDTGEVAAVEALVRWEHPQRGMVSPADFLPVAESSGLISQIGRIVLYQACEQMVAWNLSQPDREPLGIFVNASARELEHPAYVDTVSAALEASGLPPEQLTIEVTETVAMLPGRIGEVADTLTGLGVAVALDDFGTGYSSLGRLGAGAMSVIKLDREFISSDTGEPLVLRAVGHIARELGLWSVAEGIEHPDEIVAAHEAGFNAGQGFLFSRPVEARAVTELLAGACPFGAAVGAAATA